MTSDRKFDKKNRKGVLRKQKPVVLIVAEGENVTESQYFKSFQRQNAACNIRIVLAKHIIDPEGMLKSIQQKWRELGLDARKGDKAYVVLDLDCNQEKGELIKKLQSSTQEIDFIVSNPCFEVWFLLHFRYSTRQYVSGNAVIKELKNYIPEYEKNLDVAERLKPLQEIAERNAERLKGFLNEMGVNLTTMDCNPYTDAEIVVKKIKE